jgi:hypothetical protein
MGIQMKLTKKEFSLLVEKLTAADLHCIRYSMMLGTARLAEIFGVSVSTIQRARTNSFFRSRGDHADWRLQRKAHRIGRRSLHWIGVPKDDLAVLVEDSKKPASFPEGFS